jgi:hypothetical protein
MEAMTRTKVASGGHGAMGFLPCSVAFVREKKRWKGKMFVLAQIKWRKGKIKREREQEGSGLRHRREGGEHEPLVLC